MSLRKGEKARNLLYFFAANFSPTNMQQNVLRISAYVSGWDVGTQRAASFSGLMQEYFNLQRVLE